MTCGCRIVDYDCAELQVLNFQRQDLSGNFLGDDDHEAWTALRKAIAAAEGQPTGEAREAVKG